MTKYAKIAVSMPAEDLAAADRLAERLDRSRSWIVAEAVRRYVAQEQPPTGLDPSRRVQLARDLALTAEERVREAEETLRLQASMRSDLRVAPRRFPSYEEFAAWRRAATLDA